MNYKKLVALGLCVSMVLPTTCAFASSTISQVVDDESTVIEKTQFRTEYEETPFEYYGSTETTEDDIAAAVRLACDEANIAFYVVGAGIAKSLASAVANAGSKTAVIEAIKGYAPTIGGVAATERFTGVVLNHLTMKASIRATDKKTKKQYRVNMYNGKRDLEKTFITFRTKVFERNSSKDRWTYKTTEEYTVVW